MGGELDSGDLGISINSTTARRHPDRTCKPCFTSHVSSSPSRLQEADAKPLLLSFTPPAVSSLPRSPGRLDGVVGKGLGSASLGLQSLLCHLPASYFPSLSLDSLSENRDRSDSVHWL